ncbi:2'-5' RNA ligase family protein [Lutispora thermophila]|uniref:2'-5' RNA ligase n=1 Tax=Lutispora thermophila DSM 19022 TaxID=1122184 RepID=A0A1M6D0E9_9FIRM|nr:2'-5' RNA ligase family protein [Lutispora thermophila]SHI66544.1 2'-5' RNA ligase [Lutispora thermophila DSM 19022]
MKERTIMLFPKFSNIDIINEIRTKYDPLADKVLPHITLIFPFKSDFGTNEIEKWLDTALKNVKPFEVQLQGFTKQEDKFGNYLFLNIVKGMDDIKQIQEMLIAMKKFDYPYIPHMTVGKFQTKQELDMAYDEVKNMNASFATIIDRVSVEIIGDNEVSIIEIEHKLGC